MGERKRERGEGKGRWKKGGREMAEASKVHTDTVGRIGERKNVRGREGYWIVARGPNKELCPPK